MRGLSRARHVVVGMAVSVLVLTGCSSSGEATDPVAGTAEEQAIVIEPASIADAETYAGDGVALDLPAGLTVDRRELTANMVQLVVQEPGQERAPVIVTVSREGAAAATDDAVRVSSSTAAATLGSNGATDVVETPAAWSAWAFATAVRASLETAAADGTPESREVVMLTVRDDEGTAVVSVSAEAPAGELESSVAYEILRTVRPAPATS